MNRKAWVLWALTFSALTFTIPRSSQAQYGTTTGSATGTTGSATGTTTGSATGTTTGSATGTTTGMALPGTSTNSPQLIPGMPGSGIVMGDGAITMKDMLAALRIVVRLIKPTPAAIAAVDMNDDGVLDIRDVIMMLRITMGEIPLPQRPAVTATGPPWSFPALPGWHEGSAVWYIGTDDSDPAMAAAMGINYAPALAKAAGTATKPMYFFFTQVNGKLTPVAGQWPVFGTAPLLSDYTPLWHIINVIVAPGYKANTITRLDQIVNAQGTAAGGAVVRVSPTAEVMNCSILFDAVGPGGRPYVTRQATFSADAKMVSLPMETVLFNGASYLMVAPDSSDADDAKAHRSNFAPGLSAADSVAIPFYVVFGSNGKSLQAPVLSAAPDPVGPTNANIMYSPIWHLTKVQWAPIAKPTALTSNAEIQTLLKSGELMLLAGGFNFNCPVVAKQSATPPATTPPGTGTTTPMTVSMSNFQFSPKDITVPVGTKVTWTNKDQRTPHTSTGGPPGKANGTWNSGTLNPGQSFSIIFTKTGTFPYFCKFHFAMGMVGSVTVK